jgi:hypothetical protein
MKTVIRTVVKAAGDWELDVLAIPFGSRDSDGQWFDADTNLMSDVFTTPAVVYYHGISPDRQGLQGDPEIIGKAVRVERKADGVWVRVVLDRTKAYARRIWEAAKRTAAAASSGSIAHLARLEGGKLYDKGVPGRIAVWPFAELSLIDVGEGRSPANPYAVALPALKAVYAQAGIALPVDIEQPEPEADAAGATAVVQSAKAAKADVVIRQHIGLLDLLSLEADL